jgi:hypothetical protein
MVEPYQQVQRVQTYRIVLPVDTVLPYDAFYTVRMVRPYNMESVL